MIRAVRNHINYTYLLGFLACISLAACEDVGYYGNEAPPSRARSFGENWPKSAEKSEDSDIVANTTPAATPMPATPPPAAPEGAMTKVLEVWLSSNEAPLRERVITQVLPDLTPGDVTAAFTAIKSGHRLEATAGMALLTRHYGSKREWNKVDDAYKQLFQSVPELRVEPEFVLEHAWAKMKVGNYEDALELAFRAERFFQNLPADRSTLAHQSRLLECKGWCYEHLYRAAAISGTKDEEAALQQQRAVQAWEALAALLESSGKEDQATQARLETVQEHLEGLKAREQ